MVNTRTTNRAAIGIGTPNSRGVITYEVKSENRKGITHRISVQVETARIHCSCEDFRFRHAKGQPTLMAGKRCKHLNTYTDTLAIDLLNATPEEWRGGIVKEFVETGVLPESFRLAA